tara:strand:+ start:7736 stop:8272 length:537 start_codon:yes stop_codon:yes gene_type:complete
MTHNLKCELTTSKREIREYQELRSNIYKNELDWNIDEEKLKNFDKKGYIFVLKNQDEVVGGARVMLSKDMNMMSSECVNYSYIKLLRDNNLYQDKYCEINDIIVKPEFRGECHISDKTTKFCIQNNQDYLLTVQDKKRCRLYKIWFNKLGYKSILSNLWSSLVEYNYSQDYVMITLLK